MCNGHNYDEDNALEYEYGDDYYDDEYDEYDNSYDDEYDDDVPPARTGFLQRIKAWFQMMKFRLKPPPELDDIPF